MKIFNRFLALTLALIALSFVHVNAQSFSGGSRKSDRTIEQQIFRKLINLPDYGVFDHIAYQVDGNTVILSGKVFSLGTRSQAANAVKDVPGVERVVNNIENLPPSGFDTGSGIRSFANSLMPLASVRIFANQGRR